LANLHALTSSVQASLVHRIGKLAHFQIGTLRHFDKLSAGKLSTLHWQIGTFSNWLIS